MNFWVNYFMMGIVTFAVMSLYTQAGFDDDDDDTDMGEDEWRVIMRLFSDQKFLWTCVAAIIFAWPILVIGIFLKGRKR